MRKFLLEMLRSFVPLVDLVFGREPWLFVPDGDGFLVRIEFDPMTNVVLRIVNTVTGAPLETIDIGDRSLLVGQALPEDPETIERVALQILQQQAAVSS